MMEAVVVAPGQGRQVSVGSAGPVPASPEA